MKRLFALRLLEEECEEAQLHKQRQLQHVCLAALKAFEARKADASRALHTALASGDRGEAISAEMALACGPMERRKLERRLMQVDAMVEAAAAAWQVSRMRRLQMETIVEIAEANHRKEALTREQRMLDGWFLLFRPQPIGAPEDESFQRERAPLAEHDGPVRAKNDHE